MEPQQTGFLSGFVLTESTAFDSYDLDYLVTFNINRNTIFIKQDGESQSFKLSHALDDPSQCQNLVGPATHYLICLAKNGHLPLLINITSNSVTNQTIPVDESKGIIKIGILAENRFYLLNDQQELSVYLIATTLICVGTYTVRPNTDFIITTASSDINCTVMEDTDSNSDKSPSTPVVAIVVSIIVAAVIGIPAIVFIVVFVVRKQINKRATTSEKKEDDNVNHESQKDVDNDRNDNNTNLNNPITTNNCNGSISEDIAQPVLLENGYTGERNVEPAEDPPTKSIDPSEEVGGNQHCILVHSTIKDFQNATADPTRRVQNESNNDETQFFELKSENCVVPLECSELDNVDNLPPREDPVGNESK